MFYVYLISATYGNDIIWKIGVSKHPYKRFKEHKTANPNLIEIVCLYECYDSRYAYFIESNIKKFLKDFKIDGEWFESISLNQETFLLYCEKYYKIAQIYFETIKNLKK